MGLPSWAYLQVAALRNETYMVGTYRVVTTATAENYLPEDLFDMVFRFGNPPAQEFSSLKLQHVLDQHIQTLHNLEHRIEEASSSEHACAALEIPMHLAAPQFLIVRSPKDAMQFLIAELLMAAA